MVSVNSQPLNITGTHVKRVMIKVVFPVYFCTFSRHAGNVSHSTKDGALVFQFWMNSWISAQLDLLDCKVMLTNSYKVD